MLILAKDVKNLPVQKEDEVPQDVALEVLEEDPQVPATDLVVKTRELLQSLRKEEPPDPRKGKHQNPRKEKRQNPPKEERQNLRSETGLNLPVQLK